MPDAEAVQASIRDITTIARRNVALHLPDGNFSHYITNHDAYLRVQSGQADWLSEEHKGINLLPERLIAHGYCKEDWQIRQSGYAGPLVLQLVTRA